MKIERSINDPVKVIGARWNANGTITCQIFLTEDQEEAWSVTASATDSAEHSVKLFYELEAGKWGAVAEYTENDARHDRVVQNIQLQNTLIADADSIIGPLSDERDAEIISDADLKRWKAWVVYRKALREIDVSKDKVSWPAKP